MQGMYGFWVSAGSEECLKMSIEEINGLNGKVLISKNKKLKENLIIKIILIGIIKLLFTFSSFHFVLSLSGCCSQSC